ncbi:hypothetical protein [Bacillus atrophaeus]
MQLVVQKVHRKTGYTGGRHFWVEEVRTDRSWII